MAIVYFNVPGSTGGGGPSVFVHKTATELIKRGHRVIYKNPQLADFAIGIINADKILRQVKAADSGTKVGLRIDGIFNKIYNEKFNRAIRPDMTALHSELLNNLPKVDHTIYQSKWSRDRIWDEIVKVDRDYSVIHNGVDTNLFKPTSSPGNDITLLHVGKMRDFYLMEMIIGTYKEVRARGFDVKLLLVGSMDAGCKKVFDKERQDSNITYMGNINNHKLPSVYAASSVFLDVRQGASCNNVVAEAQACGIPVVTPSWGGSCEMIIDGKTGVIVDGGQWDYNGEYIHQLANGVTEILSDVPGFKRNSREHALSELTIEKMVDRYISAMKM